MRRVAHASSTASGYRAAVRAVWIACVVFAAACGRVGLEPSWGGNEGGGDGDIEPVSVPRGAFGRQILITAGNIDAPSGYTVSITFDHAALVAAGKSLADGSDVGILRNGV